MKRLTFVSFLLAIQLYSFAGVTDSIVNVRDCSAPQNLTASLTDGHLQLTWDPVEGVSYYQMYYIDTYLYYFSSGATTLDTMYQGGWYRPWAENRYFVVAHFEDGSECSSDTVSLGPEALDFIATDLQGNEIHLYEILDRGQYVFLDFFHYTCGPCRDIIPYIEESYYYYGCNEKDVFYMEITPYDDDDRCQLWCEEFAVEYPTISKDRGGSVIDSEFRIPAHPFVILIAPDHSIVLQTWGNSFGYEGINSLQSIVNAFAPFGIEHHQCYHDVSEVDEQALVVFPNPADDFLNLSVETMDTVRIYNALGQLMDSFVAENEQVQLVTGRYPNGVYVVQVNGKVSARFVVSH